MPGQGFLSQTASPLGHGRQEAICGICQDNLCPTGVVLCEPTDMACYLDSRWSTTYYVAALVHRS